MQLKQSPSVIEIGGMNDGLQSDPSQVGEGDKSFRNPQSRSPASRIMAGGSDDDPAQRSLNRHTKNTSSSRKIKPMYPITNKQGSSHILKVVQEDNSSDHTSSQMPRIGPQGSMIISQNQSNMSPVSNISAPGMQGNSNQQYILNNQMQHIQQRGLKMSSRERNTKLIV